MFSKAGFKEYREYRYWSIAKRDVDFDAMIEDLNQAPKHSVIILHSCAHNPTGCDLNEQQWNTVADICQVRFNFKVF